MTAAYEFTSKGSRGAASEMYACAHLLATGWHVFRAVSQACPVDLIAYKGEQMLRVEVKSSGYPGNAANSFSQPRNDEWDLLLIVTPEGKVFEFPAGLTYVEIRDALRAKLGMPKIGTRRVKSSGIQHYQWPVTKLTQASEGDE